MRVVINGVDITNMIKAEAVSWQRNDVEGPNAGRNQTGTMIRDRKCIKVTWNIPCRLLRKSEANTLLRLIEPEYVYAVIDDPEFGDGRQGYFYSNNVPATYRWKDPSGTEWWEGITFPLVEV